MKNKIVSLKELGDISSSLKKGGKKIVHCHGVFDLLHPGHLKHFEAAKKFGDVLIVTITDDKHVNKGPGRPIFNETLRAETLAAIQLIDYVAINYNQLAISALEIIQPDFYVKGQEYKNAADDITGGIIDEKNKVEQYGGKLAFTEEIQFSSTKLINRNIDFASDELKSYLELIRQKTSFEKLKSDFDTIAQMKVLVIGDIILDEYTFVDPLGKASKSATITAKKYNSEMYAGGVLAVANHIANFTKKVKLISTYGNNFGKDHLNFIKSKLNPNIEFQGILTEDRPTVLKRRYVDKTFKNKLFELIEIEDAPLSGDIQRQITQKLSEVKDSYDLIVVADFGHGLINDNIVDHLIKTGLFLSVNTQTNSANQGFNLLTKYPKCDFFSIDENESRLAAHDKYSQMSILVRQLLNRTSAKTAAVTLGTKGSLVTKVDSDYIAIAPVLSDEVVDTIGAGDAYLSITSLMAKNGNSPDEIAFVGNAVGAMAVRILGNKSYIEKVPLLKYLKTLLT
jgi:rfaE bifunctional protein nucleotidyltransferase chain/domain